MPAAASRLMDQEQPGDDEDDIDGCEIDFTDDDQTTDEELPVTRWGRVTWPFANLACRSSRGCGTESAEQPGCARVVAARWGRSKVSCATIRLGLLEASCRALA
jgi:hypothetical protein